WTCCAPHWYHAPRRLPSGLAGRSSSRHPGFRVANLDALSRRLENAGVEIITDGFSGHRRFFVRAPSGNRLEFVERTGGEFHTTGPGPGHLLEDSTGGLYLAWQPCPPWLKTGRPVAVSKLRWNDAPNHFEFR